MCGKAVDYHQFAFKSVSDGYKTQEMCNIAANTYPYTLMQVFVCNKTQKMREKVLEF